MYQALTTWCDIQQSHGVGIINAVLYLRWTYSHQQEREIQEAEGQGLAACRDALRLRQLGLPFKARCGVKMGLRSWSKEDGTEGGHESFCLAMPWEVSHYREGWEKDTEKQAQGSWHWQGVPVNASPSCWLPGGCWQPRSPVPSPSNLEIPVTVLLVLRLLPCVWGSSFGIQKVILWCSEEFLEPWNQEEDVEFRFQRRNLNSFNVVQFDYLSQLTEWVGNLEEENEEGKGIQAHS